MANAASLSLTQFYLSNEVKTYELDGRSQASVLFFSSMRVSVLEEQLSDAFGAPTPMSGVASIAAIVGMVKAVVFPILWFFFGMVRQIEGWSLSLTRGIQWVDRKLSSLADVIDPVVTVASLVSYAVMIYFGHYLAAGIALAGLALVAIKRLHWLPSWIDAPLSLASHLTSIYAVAISSAFILWKILQITLLGIDFINRLSMYQSLQPYFSSCLVQDFAKPDERPSLSVDAFFQPGEENLETAFENLKFTINPASLFAEKVSQVLPTDFAEGEFGQITLEEIYERVEERIEKEKMAFNEDEQKGWESLKKSIVKGATRDELPPNFDQLRIYLKAILFLYSNEETDKFQEVMRDLAAVGNQCVEGWSRDIALLHPRTKDWEWTFHHHHAVFRSALIEAAIGERVRSLNEQSDSFADNMGGSNNIHLVSRIEEALEHRWHSYRAKVSRSIHGRSILKRVLQSQIDRTYADPFLVEHPEEMRDYLEFLLLILHNEGISLLPQFFAEVSEIAKENYTPERLVDALYEKIKPQYRDSLQGEEMRVEVFREIEWSSVTPWISSLHERGYSLCDDKDEYNSFWVGKDFQDQPFLTKNAIYLLLWDLGILTCSELPRKVLGTVAKAPKEVVAGAE